MRKVISYITLLSVAAFFMFSLSCTKEPFTSSDFMIKVDSIKLPDIITAGTPFDMEFFGIVGSDGCFSFKTFKRSSQNQTIVIEAWGTYAKTGENCTGPVVTMDGIKLNISFPVPGNYTIYVREPDTYALARQITVN
jgi:hypothetical protein